MKEESKHRYIKFYLFRRLFSNESITLEMEDEVSFCPRMKELDKHFLELASIISKASSEEEKDKLICSLLEKIDPENYVYPNTEEWADAMKMRLTTILNTAASEKKVFGFERVSFQRLGEVHADFLNEFFASADDPIEVLSENENAISLYRLKSGHKIAVTASFFQIFGVITKRETICRTVKAYTSYHYILGKAGR